MSSYTSSSKYKVIVAISIFLCLSIALDGALGLYVTRKTSAQTWIENKRSKVQHLKITAPNNLDAVFIGSSRTVFHISSHVFKDAGFDIYNLGVSSMALTDYPYFVKAAIAKKPKKSY